MNLVKIVLLYAVPLTFFDEKKGELVEGDGKCGTVYSVELEEAKRLDADGYADGNPINIAFHSGDTATYQRLLQERAAAAAEPAPTEQGEV